MSLSSTPRLFCVFGCIIGTLPGTACSSRSSPTPTRHADEQAATPIDPVQPRVVSFVPNGSTIEVRLAGELFTAFTTENTQKPYLYPLLAPGGRHVTRGFPIEPRAGEEHDHPHHTSVWFAHGDVNSHDFWTGARGARIVPVAPPTTESRGADGVITSRFEWRNAQGHALCTEDRTMRFAGDHAAHIIDFDFILTAGDEPVTFGDTKEGTFGVRLAPSLRLTGPVARGSIVSSTGLRDAACWGKRAAWVEYSGPVDGRDLGVVIFDHPANPRHPTWWHARDYGLFAANPFGAHDFEGKPPRAGSFTLGARESIRLRYRLLIHDGLWGVSRIDAAFKSYAEKPPTDSAP